MKSVLCKLFLTMNTILIVLPVIYNQSDVQFYNNSEGFKKEDITKKLNKNLKECLINSDPLIFINKTEDFSLNGFTGNGTKINPFILANITLTSNSDHIVIYNTSSYFILDNITLDGIDRRSYGIFLYNVDNGEIRNSKIMNLSFGLYMQYSSNIILIDSEVFNNDQNGIDCTSSSYISFTNNTIYKNNKGISLIKMWVTNISECRIYDNLEEGAYSQILCYYFNYFRNSIYNNGKYGIYCGSSLDISNIEGNIIYNNGYDGIRIHHQSDNNKVFNNSIFNNKGNGILLTATSRENIIENNYIAFNNNSGARISDGGESYANRFVNNTFIGNNNSGINIESYSCSNVIIWNTFIGNEDYLSKETLAIDNGLGNTYAFNYWENHNKTDQNYDGVLDEVYYISGNANSTDEYPINQNKTMNSNFLTNLSFINPLNAFYDIMWLSYGDYHSISNEIPILYTGSISSQREKTYYSIYISDADVEVWQPIIINTTRTISFMNLDNVISGEYTLKVEARSESGLSKIHVTKPFWLWNGSAILSKPVIKTPYNNKTFSTNEIIEISWYENHYQGIGQLPVYYSLYITNSTDKQARLDECELIISKTTELQYNLSLSNMEEGTYQLILVTESGGYTLANSPYLIIEIIKSRKTEFSSYLVLLFALLILKGTKKFKKFN